MTMIYTPGRHLEGEMSPVSMGVEGWFTLRARRRSGRVTRERSFRRSGTFHNLITDLGLNRFGTQSDTNLYRYCHVGTGTTPPANSDTQLVTFLGNVTTNAPVASKSNSGSPDYYSSLTLKWTSAIGALGNNNLTEIGISAQTTNGLLFSRELIRDSEGDPTSFPIDTDEQLEVTYELRIYPKLTDTEAEVTIGGTTYDTTTRPLAVSSSTYWGATQPGSGDVQAAIKGGFGNNIVFSGDLVAVTAAISSISGHLGEATSVSSDSYTNDSFLRDGGAMWNVSTGNGDIKTVQLRYGCALFQTRYDPVIVKTNVQTLTLRQRIAWARR